MCWKKSTIITPTPWHTRSWTLYWKVTQYTVYTQLQECTQVQYWGSCTLHRVLSRGKWCSFYSTKFIQQDYYYKMQTTYKLWFRNIITLHSCEYKAGKMTPPSPEAALKWCLHIYASKLQSNNQIWNFTFSI